MGTYQFSVARGIKSASDETDSPLKIAQRTRPEQEKGSAIDNDVSPTFVSVDDPKEKGDVCVRLSPANRTATVIGEKVRKLHLDLLHRPR